MFCVCTSRDFILPLIYVYRLYIFHINHVSSKDEIKTWGPLALSGPASLSSTSAHVQVMAQIVKMIEEKQKASGGLPKGTVTSF